MTIRKIISRSIGTDVIVADDLANNSVTTAEIQDGAITAAKIASAVTLGVGAFLGDNASGALRGDTTNGKKDIFRVHEQELNTNVTIPSTDNALAAGPLSVANNITLTVSGNLTII
jgi:hypothetical protein